MQPTKSALARQLISQVSLTVTSETESQRTERLRKEAISSLLQSDEKSVPVRPKPPSERAKEINERPLARYTDELFDFARKLKTKHWFAQPHELEPEVLKWCEETGKDFDEIWPEFPDKFNAVRHRVGENVYLNACQLSSTFRPPKYLRAKYPDKPRYVALANLCLHMQAQVGEKHVFSLSSLQAAAYIDCDWGTAWRILRRLCADRFLVCTERQKPGGKRANRYRYLGAHKKPPPE